MRLPFRPEELKSPRKAASRLGEQNAIQLYLTEVEPAFRNDPEPYPKDWAWRKFGALHAGQRTLRRVPQAGAL